MAGQQSQVKQMPVSGIQQYGNAAGKPAETSQIKTGDDLRNGGGK